MKNDRKACAPILNTRKASGVIHLMPRSRGRLRDYFPVLIGLLFTTVFIAPALAGSDAFKVEYYEPLSTVTITSLSSTTNSSSMVVSAVFSNASNKNQNIYYRVVWLDASGNPIAVGEPWNMVPVAENSDRAVSLSIQNPGVSDYRIQVSLGRNF